MLERPILKSFGDFDLPLAARAPKGACFARVCGWSDAVKRGVWRFHEAARLRGVIVEGRIPNPDEGQIARLTRALGTDFEPTAAFVEGALGRWLPGLSEERRRAASQVIAEQLDALARQGKPASVLKNAYVKLMCWLGLTFGGLVPLLAEEQPPRALYCGESITAQELTALRALNAMGCDVLLVLTGGDQAYAPLDPASEWSQRLPAEGGAPFPEGFSLRALKEEMRAAEPAPQRAAPAQPQPSAPRRTPAPKHRICTNAWMPGPDYRNILTPPSKRGDDPGCFYNAYIRVRGVEDRENYVGELYRFYRKLPDAGRRVAAVDGPMPPARPEEIAKIRRRGSYATAAEVVADLAGNLPVGARDELQALMRQALNDVLGETARDMDSPRRVLTAGVCLLCRVHRYYPELFHGWREGDVPVFLLMGGCATADDALFVRFLSRLPVDVLLLAPDLEKPCVLEDPALMEQIGAESLAVARFPRDEASLRMSTAAAHAEREVGESLYADTGVYRNRQFARANAITLRTTRDELFMLWDQDMKYRPGFSAEGDAVTMPVLFAKLSGVERGDLRAYWDQVRRLTGGDTLLFSQIPLIGPGAQNPYRAMALRCLRDGRLDRRALARESGYPFALMRREVQDHILDKLQLMLDRRIIRGTGTNGTEYAVVATVLNMDRDLLRRLQAFDFARRNPKIVCVSTREDGATLEDAILLAFLNLAGFDIALFVPTGYQSVERFMAEGQPVEHQLGAYMYDLETPDLTAPPRAEERSWLKRLLRREN